MQQLKGDACVATCAMSLVMMWSCWACRDAPDLQTPAGREAAPSFIDRVVSTKIPPESDDPEEQRLRWLVTKVSLL